MKQHLTPLETLSKLTGSYLELGFKFYINFSIEESYRVLKGLKIFTYIYIYTTGEIHALLIKHLY